MANTIHYIWWGPVPVGELEQVNEVARQCREKFEVFFWCKKEHAEAFIENLERNVVVCGLDLQKGGALPNALVEVVAELENNKAYSAIKDVLMLFVLHEHGGVYLDTTTGSLPRAIRSKYRAEPLELGAWAVTLNTKNFLGFAFPEIGFGGMRDFSPQSLPWASDATSSSSKRVVVYTPSLDYWAAWSKAGNVVIKRALDQYILFVKNMPKGVLGSKSRNSIIGDLITMSVQHALLPLLKQYTGGDGSDEAAQLAARTLAKSMWPAATLDNADYGRYHANFLLPSLGVMKWHKGTWRNVAV